MRGMNTGPIPIVDRDALRRQQIRAAKAPVTFLTEEVATEVHEKLKDVNRTFSRVAIIGRESSVLASSLPQATVFSDDDVIDFAGEKFDLVIHDLSLHWANDPVGQLVQCRLALQPDGLFIGTLFGGQSLHELRSVLAEAEIETLGGLSPRVAPMGEIRDLGALLQRAGFALPVADSMTLSVTYEDQFKLMKDLRAMGEANALFARMKTFTPRRLLELAAVKYQNNFAAGENRINATFEIVMLTGWAPDESQPKPLRPGSATNRLADALGTTETKLD